MEKFSEGDIEILKFISQDIEVTCQKCNSVQKILVLNAWMLDIGCMKCGYSVANQEIRNQLLAPKMKLEQALHLNALKLFYDSDKKINTRQIVIDINCAMEIILKNKIVNYLELRHVDKGLVDYLMQEYKQPDKKTKLLKALKFQSPEKMVKNLQKIRDLRNKVAHQGYTPTIEEARETVNGVTKILNSTQAPPVMSIGEWARSRARMRKIVREAFPAKDKVAPSSKGRD